MWSIKVYILCLCLANFGRQTHADIIDDFLAATPIHPQVPTPEVVPDEGAQTEEEDSKSKIEIATDFTERFNPDDGCNQNLTDLQIGDHGIITSPNYPKRYPSRSSCQWVLQSPQNSHIEATIVDMHTQPWFFAYFDYLMISKTGDFSKIDRMAGDINLRTPMTFVSTENKLGIRFHSSAPFSYRGFKIQYVVRALEHKFETAPPSPFDDICGRSPLLSGEEIPTSTTTEVPENSTTNYINFFSDYETDEKIIGGQKTKPGSFPWMAALLIDGRSFCGGSIISDQHILTAAHCTDGANKINVLLGAVDVKNGKEPNRLLIEVTRENIFQHPSYNRRTISHDITVIRLPHKIQFNENVKPICLPNHYHSSKTFAWEKVRVSGWGKPYDWSRGISSALKNTTVSVLPNSLCRAFFRSIVTGNLICVATRLNASPCNGDSGGPLIIQQRDSEGHSYFMQVGIVSFGGRSCMRSIPVGFTRVTVFIDYIHSIMNKTN